MARELCRVSPCKSPQKPASSGDDWNRVADVGRQQGTLVFELLGEVGRVPRWLLTARDRYEAALDAYFLGRFDEAAVGFADAAQMRPEDLAAEMMARRARELAQHPPTSDWDGVHQPAKVTARASEGPEPRIADVLLQRLKGREMARNGRSKRLVPAAQPLRFWFINCATGWNKGRISGRD